VDATRLGERFGTGRSGKPERQMARRSMRSTAGRCRPARGDNDVQEFGESRLPMREGRDCAGATRTRTDGLYHCSPSPSWPHVTMAISLYRSDRTLSVCSPAEPSKHTISWPPRFAEVPFEVGCPPATAGKKQPSPDSRNLESDLLLNSPVRPAAV
jgi:hypothetical protein